MKKNGLMSVYWAMLLALTLFLASCGGQNAQNDGVKPVSDPQLEITYQKIFVLPIGISEQFAKDYPQAAVDCRQGLIEGLTESKRFQVSPVDAMPAPTTERSILVVKLEITDMRIASRAARFWGGAFVGSSYVNVRMTLTDVHAGQVVRDKIFSTHNNAYGAAWSFGASDASIPKDMGKIVGDYITAVVPPAGFPAKQGNF